MKYRRLGNAGIQLSELALGTMTFGNETDDKAAQAMVGRFLDAGGNIVDSADAYNGGRSEEILGRSLGRRRDEVVLSTKARFATGPGRNDRGASRRHLLDTVHQSLRRLGTDRIDLYQMHCWDPRTGLEETLSTLDNLVQAGKVRYIGASNYAGWHLAKALGISAHRNREPFVALQAQYSLICRGADRELLPLCGEENLAFLAWSPLGGGVLSGKYAGADAWPDGTRAAEYGLRGSSTMRNRFTERNAAIVEAVLAVAEEVGREPAQVALRWVLEQPGVTSTLLGARTEEQLRANLTVLDFELPPEARKSLDEASCPEPEYPYDFLEHSSTV